jgi:hypothetical protein
MPRKSKVASNNQTKSNGRGGKRAGSGRKAGSATKKTREIADRAMENGISPLEFMLEMMRSQPPEGLGSRELKDWVVMQFEAAKAAAPYIHPRLAAIEHSGGVDVALSIADQIKQAHEARKRG